MKEKEDQKNKLNNKTKLYIIAFSIFFIACLVSYYFYSSKNKKTFKKIEPSNLSTILASPVEEKVEKAISEIPKIIERKEVKCTDLSFYKHFIRISLRAYQGEDYSENSISIQDSETYSLYSVELLELLSLAKENHPDYYFINEFNHLIDKFYQHHSNSLLSNEFSQDFFRYRKTGKRALESEGADKYIAIAKNEIARVNFTEALKALDNINDEHGIFEGFKQQLKFRIRIIQLVQDLENKIFSGR